MHMHLENMSCSEIKKNGSVNLGHHTHSVGELSRRAGDSAALPMPRIQAAHMVEIELTSDRDQIVGQHQPGSSEAPAPSHVGASVGSGVLNMKG